jgi:hypothetical protein
VKDAAKDHVALILVGLDDLDGYMVGMEGVVLERHILEKLHGFFCDALLNTRGDETPRNMPGQQAPWFNGAIAEANARRQAARASRRNAT